MNYRPSALVLRNGHLVRRYRDEAKNAPVPASVENLEEIEPRFGKPRRFALTLFLMSLLIPLSVTVMSIRLTPYTFVLIVAFVPLLVTWIGQKYSPIILPDWLMLFYALWSAVALVYNHGLEPTIQPIGIHLLESFCAYLMGRMLVRDVPSMRFMVTIMVLAFGVMLPFVVMESVTGKKMILDAFAKLGETPVDMDTAPRFGFMRAQGAFEHPILMGVVTASIVALAVYTWQGKGNRLLRLLGAPICVVSALTSLSTGALLTLNVQFGLMAWGRLFRESRQRWNVLMGMLATVYLTIDLISNRTPIHVFVSYATFSAQSSYNRILIWQYGMENAMAHPILGIGLNDWERPLWMSASFDNFWLFQAMRYGFPAFFAIAGAMLIIVFRLGKANLPTEGLEKIRQGMMFSLVAFAVTIFSVHLWHASFVWFCFLIGACVWPIFLSGRQPVASSATPVSGAGRDPAVRPQRVTRTGPSLRKGR